MPVARLGSGRWCRRCGSRPAGSCPDPASGGAVVRSSGRRLVASAAVVTVKDDPDGHGPIGARRAWPRELAGSTPACVPRSQRQTGTARPSSLAVRLSGRSRLLFRRLGADWALSASIDPGASAAQPASTLGSRRPDSNRGPLHYERRIEGARSDTRGNEIPGNRVLSNAVDPSFPAILGRMFP